MLINITDMVDARWRDRTETIYAGRTFSTDDVARADQNVHGRMVAISDQFSSSLVAYAAMYGLFLRSLDDARVRRPDDAAALQRGMQATFDEIISDYKVRGLLALEGTALATFPSEQYRQSIDVITGAAEQWTLAHETAHHIARDMSARKDKSVEAALKAITQYSSMRQKLSELPPLHRTEVEADLLATLILAGHFIKEDRHPMTPHMALLGGCIALLAVAHLRDEWIAEPGDSHPGIWDRLQFLLTFISELYGPTSADPNGRSEHITISRYSATVMTYALVAMDPDLAEEIARSIPMDTTPYKDMPYPIVLTAHFSVVFSIASENYRGATRDL